MSAPDPARGQPAEGMIGEKWRISLLKKIYVIGCFTNMKSGTFKSTIKYNFDILWNIFLYYLYFVCLAPFFFSW